MSDPDSPDETGPGLVSQIRRVLERLEVDRAVAYALSLRVWQLVGGTVSVLLMSVYFSQETQGYYYTLNSLMTLQCFFDLGLGVVIINIASHEWMHLRLDDTGCVEGDAAALSRLVSLGRLLFRWYAIASVLFMVGVGIGGAYFLAQRPQVQIEWQQPWWLLVILTGLLLWTMPFTALLEGCSQVVAVNRFRLLQAVAANLAIWAAMVLDTGLWVAVAGTAMRLIIAIGFLVRRADTFFHSFSKSPSGPRIEWRDEIWPMQWRLGLSSVAGYFAYSLLTPVLFHFHGPTLAGQMGMTWTLLMVVHSSALAWLQTRVSRFGILAAARNWDELDRLFRRVTLIALAVMTLGGLGLCGLVYGMGEFAFRLADRLLPPLPTLIFVLALVAQFVVHAQAIYVHAHKQDPLAAVQICGNAGIGLAVWWLGRGHGAVGAATGYLAVVIVFILPTATIIWARRRREWHA
jgi:O-antigen/teichoic acid export membrane protein